MNSTGPIVTRFAPSPTGFMHIGGVRTALFAYLWARKNNGTCILRIEDTDKEREVAGSTDHIKKSLEWLGITWDAFYMQSERLSIYKKYALELIAKGHAYVDPFTPEQIEGFRKEAEMAKRPFLFREHRPSDADLNTAWDGTKPLRLKTPTIRRMKWHDAVRGDLEAGEEALDDFIIMKSDGYPTYNFAHIVDDLEMNVTHILRGEEFISSTPKYLSLYEALGITPPRFVTLPSILRNDKTKKLGKRDGAKDILEYEKEGYIKEAMINMLALIGWNPGTEQEIFTMKNLVDVFDIAKVQKSGGVFNEEKLDWFNKEHIALLSNDDFLSRATSFSSQEIPVTLIPLIKEKIHKLSDISLLIDRGGELSFVFAANDYPADMLLWKKEPDLVATNKHIEKLIEILTGLDQEQFDPAAIKDAVWTYADTNGRGTVLWPFRVALTGLERSPDPFVSASLLGKAETLVRLGTALTKLS